MSNLKSLDISYNKLTLIDEAIFQYLNQLELLYVNNNLIVNMPTKAVFNKMNSLQQLRLDSNKLFVSLSNTSTIDFSNCPFASLNNLTFLSLSNNSATNTTTTNTNINLLDSRILAACSFR